MSAAFKNENNLTLEEAWFEGIPSFTSHEIVESIIGRTPIDQWRPDTKIKNKDGVTLAEKWLTVATEKWIPFLNRLAASYPSLDGECVTISAIKGMHKRYATRSRYEASGSEVTVLEWLKLYENDWKNNQIYKDAILIQAVSVGFVEIMNLALKNGASAQVALPEITRRETLNILLKNGADPFIGLRDDPRSKLGNVLKERDGVIARKLVAKTAYEYIVSKTNEFESSKERDDVLNLLTRSKLKIKKGQSGNEEERKSVLSGAIKGAKKAKDICVAIKACMPDVWNWKFENGNTILMLLCESRYFTEVLSEFKDKIPDHVVSERNDNDESLLEIKIAKSDSLSWSSYEHSNICKKLQSIRNVRVESFIKILNAKIDKGLNSESSFVNSSFKPECPTKESREFNHSLELDSNEFWQAISEDNKTNKIFEKMTKHQQKNQDIDFKDWAVSAVEESKKDLLLFEKTTGLAKFCALADLLNVVNSGYMSDSSCITFKQALSVVSFWHDKGVDHVELVNTIGYRRGFHSVKENLIDEFERSKLLKVVTSSDNKKRVSL